MLIDLRSRDQSSAANKSWLVIGRLSNVRCAQTFISFARVSLSPFVICCLSISRLMKSEHEQEEEQISYRFKFYARTLASRLAVAAAGAGAAALTRSHAIIVSRANNNSHFHKRAVVINFLFPCSCDGRGCSFATEKRTSNATQRNATCT